MAGLGLTHPLLAVAAVGFAPEPVGGAAGVLVTPWFMNLVWLPDDEPCERMADEVPAAMPLATGASRSRRIGPETIEFLGAHEAGFGAFETCSLFSPMFEFTDQAAALATAEAVMQLLRPGPAQATGAPPAAAERFGQAIEKLRAAPFDPLGEPAPARRAFLLGRRAA